MCCMRERSISRSASVEFSEPRRVRGDGALGGCCAGLASAGEGEGGTGAAAGDGLGDAGRAGSAWGLWVSECDGGLGSEVRFGGTSWGGVAAGGCSCNCGSVASVAAASAAWGQGAGLLRQSHEVLVVVCQMPRAIRQSSSTTLMIVECRMRPALAHNGTHPKVGHHESGQKL